MRGNIFVVNGADLVCARSLFRSCATWCEEALVSATRQAKMEFTHDNVRAMASSQPYMLIRSGVITSPHVAPERTRVDLCNFIGKCECEAWSARGGGFVDMKMCVDVQITTIKGAVQSDWFICGQATTSKKTVTSLYSFVPSSCELDFIYQTGLVKLLLMICSDVSLGNFGTSCSASIGTRMESCAVTLRLNGC